MAFDEVQQKKKKATQRKHGDQANFVLVGNEGNYSDYESLNHYADDGELGKLEVVIEVISIVLG